MSLTYFVPFGQKNHSSKELNQMKRCTDRRTNGQTNILRIIALEVLGAIQMAKSIYFLLFIYGAITEVNCTPLIL